MATIKDIAERAGVSRGTVDRVLNNRGRVAPEKEAAIRKAAEELGYKPNMAAKELAVLKKQLVFGFLSPTPLMAPFFNAVLDGARQEAKHLKEYGVTVRFFEWTSPEKRLEAVSEAIRDEEFDGWVADGGYGFRLLCDVYKEKDLKVPPVITFNVPSNHGEELSFVGSDSIQEGKLAAGLAALICNREGKVALLNYGSAAEQIVFYRKDGFVTELKEHYPKMEIAGDYEIEGYNLLTYRNKAEQEDRIADEIVSRGDIKVVYLFMPADYAVCRKIRERDPEKKIRIISHDLASEEIVEYMRTGVVSAVICQEPERQGSQPLRLLFDYVGLGIKPELKIYPTQQSIVLPQNIEYMNDK